MFVCCEPCTVCYVWRDHLINLEIESIDFVKEAFQLETCNLMLLQINYVAFQLPIINLAFNGQGKPSY